MPVISWLDGEEDGAMYSGELSMKLKSTEFSDVNRIKIATFIDQNTSIAYHGNGGSENAIVIGIKPSFEPMEGNTANGFYAKIKVYTNKTETPYFIGQPKQIRGQNGNYSPTKAWEFELPDQVGFYPDFKIEYFVSLTEDGEYEKMGSCESRLYTTFKVPVFGSDNDNRLDERLLYFGCKNAHGVKSEEILINNLWAKFEIKNNSAPYGNLFQNDFNPNLGRDKIGYYLPRTTYGNWAEAINSCSGTCVAFSSIFQYSLQLQGIAALNEQYSSTNSEEQILIRQWAYVSHGTSENQNYPFQNALEYEQTDPRFNTRTGEYFWAITPEVNRIVNGSNNAVGQANPNPQAYFWSHSMVKIGTQIYDPSYGVIYNSIEDFKSRTIDGFFILNDIIINEKKYNVWLIRKSN